MTTSYLPHAGLTLTARNLSPSAVVAFVRLQYGATYNRAAGRGIFDPADWYDKNFTEEEREAARDRHVRSLYKVVDNMNLLVTQEFEMLQVSTSKSSHIGQAYGVFYDPDNEIVETVKPGDWILCWMVESAEAAEDVIKRIHKQVPVNRYYDGFKFVGRVESVRTLYQRDGSGNLSKRVNVTASSFSELDIPIYYMPSLAKNDGMKNWVIEAMTHYDKFFDKVKDQNLEQIQQILPFAIDIFLGSGPAYESAEKWRNPHGGLFVPNVISKLLGIENTSPGSYDKINPLTYAECLTTILGLQNYKLYGKSLMDASDNKAYERLIPEVKEMAKGCPHRLVTPKTIVSVFNPGAQPWDNVPIWQILNSYVNDKLNEMYTTLRVNREGLVVPTLVIRQKPFSTDTYCEDTTSMAATPYSSLPAWYLDSALVYSANVGTSNALRFNYSEIQLMAIGNGVANMYREQSLANGVSAANRTDMSGHGFRPLIGTVRASLDDVRRTLGENIEALAGKGTGTTTSTATATVTSAATATETAPDTTSAGWKRSIGADWTPARITSPFGPRKGFLVRNGGAVYQPDKNGKMVAVRTDKIVTHYGIDFGAPAGTPIVAWRGGIVFAAGPSGGHYGNVVKICSPDGTSQVYAHCSSVTVAVGQVVSAGDYIATVGSTGFSTGPHLHFEHRVGGSLVQIHDADAKMSRDLKGTFILDKFHFGSALARYQFTEGSPTDPAAEEDPYTLHIPPSGAAPLTVTEEGLAEAVEVGNQWSRLVADMVFDGHLKYTGSINALGTQAPVAVGDNLVFDGTLYHIEQVEFRFIKNRETGTANFYGTYGVSNGLRINEVDGKLRFKVSPYPNHREEQVTEGHVI